MSEHQFNIKSEPFSWDDNFSEVALEDFSMIQKDLPYTIAQNIGVALGKLKMIEDGELVFNTDRRFVKKSVNKELLPEVMKKLATYENLEEQDGVLIRAFQIQEYLCCPKCNRCEKKIGEVWIHPRLLKTDEFYLTLEEAEEVLKN